LNRRIAIRSGEESVVCSTALLRRGFISADSSGTLHLQQILDGVLSGPLFCAQSGCSLFLVVHAT
jgi:hypothetical protein